MQTLDAVVAVLLFALAGGAQTTKEWKLDLAKYGLDKPRCTTYMGHVEFLDDDRLVISAPVGDTCDKHSWDKQTDTRITVVDLQGQELASIRRPIFNLVAGPIGFAIVCTAQGIELLSRNLRVARLISPSGNGQPEDCYFGGRLSPSRTAFLIAGPGKSEFRLYQSSSSEPIAEITIVRGQSVRAVADDGFLVCSKGDQQCETLDSKGVKRTFRVPQLFGAAGSQIVGLVEPDRLLMASFDGKRLYAETSTGETVGMGDVAKLRPPFIDSSDAEISAAEPRRILYRVDGCLLGDGDDCYGVTFRRFAVYDSQTSRMLFRHSYSDGANLKISPSGRLVMEQDGATVRFYGVP